MCLVAIQRFAGVVLLLGHLDLDVVTQSIAGLSSLALLKRGFRQLLE